MSIADELKGKTFKVLDQGFVRFMDAMGTDQTIVDRARGTTGTIGKTSSEDETLLRHMMRYHHGSSFEFPEIDLEICSPFTTWRQMIRHRAGNILDEMTMWDEPSINELSGRYSIVPEMVQRTESTAWRRQSKSNRQGSGENFGTLDGEDFTQWETENTNDAMQVYSKLISNGVAKEQARKVWPMGGYTIGFMKMDLRNWLHWAALRLVPDAQLEIREYAKVIAEDIIKPLFPVTFQAFEDYVLNALTLSALDIEVVRLINLDGGFLSGILDRVFANKRERDECKVKLERLGIIKTGVAP